jgi:hypothetical protein
VELTRASLCNLLLEEGEEDLAVLVARADLPDILDVHRDGPALAALGLDEDELLAMLPAVKSDPHAKGQLTLAEVADLEQTISDRWADLVTYWVSGTSAGHA